MSTTTRSRLYVLILAAGCFTSGVNVGVLSPLIKLIGRDFGVSDAAVGQGAALHALIAGITALVVAPWVDRFPRRTVLRTECLLLLVATAISALAPGLLWLYVGRGLAGVGGAIIAATCFAAAGDLFPVEAQRNRAIGIVSSAFSVATIAGLTIVTQVADIAGWRGAMALLLVPTAMVAAGTAWLPATSSTVIAQRAGGYREVLSHARVNWLLGALIVLCMVWAGWVVFFGAFTTTVFAVGAASLSLLFLLTGGTQMLASNLTPVLLRLRSAPTVFRAFTLLTSATLLTVSFVSGAWWLVVPFVLVLGLTFGVVYLTTTVLLLDALPSARGAVMTLQTGCFEFGWAAGAAVTGVALAATDSYASIYQALALLLPVSLVFLARASRRPRLSIERAAARPVHLAS